MSVGRWRKGMTVAGGALIVWCSGYGWNKIETGLSGVDAILGFGSRGEATR
jgi:hypothetical protein